MTRPEFDGDHAAYDYALNGIPFFGAASADTPYVRDTSDWRREQFDASTEPGEQSLNDWWRRSQSSFHLGAGLSFYDPQSEATSYGSPKTQQYRFADSQGVDVWTPGQVTLLRSCSTPEAITGNSRLAGYSVGGEEGVIFNDGTTLKKHTSAGVTSSISWGSSSTVYDLCVNGGTYFVACDAGIYAGALPGSAGSKLYDFPASITRARFGWVKERLIVCANRKVYECPTSVSSPPAAMPAALYEHPTSGWVWSGVASGPDAIYLSGYVGDTSAIYATWLETTTAGSPPTLSVPTVVAELPRGEVALSIISYMGTYLVIGTNLGVRVCLIREGGGVVIGPLSIEAAGAGVYGLAVRQRFVWAGGYLAGGKSGLYRLDLSNPLDSDSLLFPYARDLEVTAAGSVIGVAPVGQTGRMAFTTYAGTLAVESASTLVSSGWLETGRIRFDTWEDKVFQFLKVNDLPGAGTLKASWRGEDAVLTDLYTWATDTIKQVNVDATDGEPHAHVAFRFTLTRSGTTVSPRLTGYQILGQPSGVRQRAIRLALLCFRKESPTGGRRSVERSTWDRIEAIEAAEEKGAVVVFQDFGTGERRLVRIDKTQFVSQETGEQRSGRADPGGILLVTLLAVD